MRASIWFVLSKKIYEYFVSLFTIFLGLGHEKIFIITRYIGYQVKLEY